MADDGGPFNALGATFFWGAWGYKFDRARLERNLKVLREAGVDYVRVLGSVGGRSWEDRETDPRWSDYDEVIAGLTDLAYDRYGLRVQWTIFGGAPFTPAGAAREALVDRFGRMARGREQKLFALEIANEARGNGFPGDEGLAELRRLGERLNDQTTVLVALTDPANGAECATYAGAKVDAITMHYERGFGSEGPLLPLRMPWTFPEAYAGCLGQIPSLVFNNEPIGPASSVKDDDDPARIVGGYVMSLLASHAAYVLHTGPGIRGGGAWDLKLSRPAHFDELPSFAPISRGLRAAKSYLPPGLANWTRRGAQDADAPIHGFDRLYIATSGSEFVALVLGAQKPITLQSRAACSIDVRDPASGNVLRQFDVSAGDGFTLPAGEVLVLTGRGQPR